MVGGVVRDEWYGEKRVLSQSWYSARRTEPPLKKQPKKQSQVVSDGAERNPLVAVELADTVASVQPLGLPDQRWFC